MKIKLIKLLILYFNTFSRTKLRKKLFKIKIENFLVITIFIN